MLLHKGWLETRFKILVLFLWLGWFLGAEYYRGLSAPAGLVGLAMAAMLVVAAAPIFLAGAGIATQPTFQAVKGLHGSTLFTLSLPVSRMRLLAARAALGWLLLSGVIVAMCCGMWILFPVLRASTTLPVMLEYAIALIACASGFYSIGVLLATFLDEVWRIWGSMAAVGALWLLTTHTNFPAAANIFRAMGAGSPLLSHMMPWTAIAFSLELAAILFFAALKVVQLREY